ncbi:MAG TPA: hypothetical protein PLK37_12235 [Terricaulis sp.]|nr:hypothetical protein [Terricaulis sp.]
MVKRGLMLAALLAFAPAAFAQEGPRANSELNQMCRADLGALWGVSLCGPLLVVEPASRAVWASEPDGEGILSAEGEGFTGLLPEGVGVANTRMHWAGKNWIMVLNPLPEDATERRVLLAHEAFHLAQEALGYSAQNVPNAHLASERGRTLLRLEMRALATALRSRGLGQRRAMQDALVLRAARQAAFPSARAEEATLERNEGLASYTGVRLGAGAGAHDYALRTLDAFDRHDSFVRAYAGATVPAYGLLLDAYRPRWRLELGANAPADILIPIAAPPAATARIVAEASARYGGPQIAAEERARAEAQALRLAALRAAYAGPRLELALTSPRFEFNPNRITPIEGLGSHYEVLTLRDVWGTLVAEAGALIGSDFRSAIAAAPGPDGLSGPGWTLTLAPGWMLAPPAGEAPWRVIPAPAEPLPAPE